MNSILENIRNSGIIPVVVMENANDAIPAANALLSGGVSVMEITFRSAAAAESIRRVASECPEMTVGAGTVTTFEQAKQAVSNGARFIVSPGYDEEIVNWCCAENLLVIPGCVTPTEIMAAQKHGLRIVKFFPANTYGGLAAIKALAGPFAGVQFVPTGGINRNNLAEIIASPYVFAVGGSWICSKQDISNHDFSKITSLCIEARQIIESVTSK